MLTALPTPFDFTYTTNPDTTLPVLQTQVAALKPGESIAIANIEGTDASVEAFVNSYAGGIGFHVVVGTGHYAALGIKSVRRTHANTTIKQVVETVIRDYVASWKIPGRDSIFAPAIAA